MKDLTVHVYHRLPTPFRTLAASLRGFCLKSLRYGVDTERFIEEASEREDWSLKKWKLWQEDQLGFVLNRAATRVPYYKQYWSTRRRKGDKRPWELLQNWPILRKEVFQQNPQAFVVEDCSIRRMFQDSTSGTTGKPLSIYLRKRTIRKWYALYEARVRRWHGVGVQDRWAILGGQLVVPFHKQSPPFWVYNAGMNQLYLSTHHLSSETARHYVNALNRYAPNHVLGYPSSMAVLATAIVEQGLNPLKLKVVLSNAEFLSERSRQIIAQAFTCPVRNTYGVAELAVQASECERGSMHIWPEVGIIEILDDEEDVPVRNGNIGRIVATGLFNPDMPLIRYEVGDRGGLHNGSQKCPCKRALPLLGELEGRMSDLIVTKDGRRIFWLNPVFYGLPIREAQIVQENLDRISVHIVTGAGYSKVDEKRIRQRLHQRVGEMDIVFKPADHIPRAKNGKFRSVVSRVS